MDCAFANLDAAGFLQIWQHFDADGETVKSFQFCFHIYISIYCEYCV